MRALWLVPVGIAVLLALIIGLPLDVSYLWYRSLGETRVFWVLSFLPTLVSVGVFAVAFLLSLWLLQPLRRLLKARLSVAAPQLPGWGLSAGTVAASAVIGFAEAGAIHWKTLLLALNATPFAYADPTFHLNAAFYVFQLPLIFQLLSAALVFILMHGAVRFLVLQALTRGGSLDPDIDARLLRWPVAALLMGLGVGEWLRRYLAVTVHSLTNPQTHDLIVAGPSYVTVHWTLFVMAGFAIALFGLGGYVLVRGQRLSLRGFGRMVLTLAGAGVAATLVGQLLVAIPARRSAQTVERPYMSETIKATRFAFGLKNLTTKPFPGNATITPADIVRDRATLKNARLADPAAFQAIFSQLQTFRQYYTFPLHDVTIDRYFANGQPVEMLLAAREIDPAYAGQGSQQGLLQYTHGYGVVAARVNTFDKNGLPILALKNMPVQGTLPGGISVKSPRIYYGEDTTTDVIAPNTLGEFDYPKGQQSAMYAYKGPGIPFVQNRLLLALTQGLGYLWQGETDAQSMFLMHRQIFDRVSRLAPWLHLDPKANLVVRKDGSVMWLLNGYTESHFFPGSASYKTPLGDINYLRNSVKVTVSAGSGAVHFYAVGSGPVRDAWERIFPGLIQPLSAMPADLRAHIVYPSSLFDVQAQVAERFHISDTSTFYSGSDNWARPQELYHQNERISMPNEQIVARIPGTSKLEFMRVLPFVPPSRPNMVGWMAALEDGPNYGKLLLYELSSGSLIPGPMQVEAEMSQNPSIASQITLWDQHGSSVIRGDMLEIPVGQGMLAIEPLYLEASQNSVPELQAILVAYNNQVAMSTTLDGALAQLFPKAAPSLPQAGSGGAPSGAALSPSLKNLLSQIVQAETRLKSDMKAGSWTLVGKDQAALDALIAQLGKQVGG